jgi:hypothetical protein
MDTKLITVFVLILVCCKTLVYGAPPIGRVPTERWFVPRQTITRLLRNTQTAIETMRPSCVHFEPGPEPCETARTARISPTTVLHKYV